MEEFLDRGSHFIYPSTGSGLQRYSCTPVHIIARYCWSGQYFGVEGKKVYEIQHEGCDMGCHYHIVVLVPCDSTGTPIQTNRSIINRYILYKINYFSLHFSITV